MSAPTPGLPDLAPLAGVRGLRLAALLDERGQVCGQVRAQAEAGALEADAQGAGLTEADVTLVAAARAVLSGLQSALGAERWNDLLLDLDTGPVLLSPAGDLTLLVAFDEVGSLGRVRLAVRRALG